MRMFCTHEFEDQADGSHRCTKCDWCPRRLGSYGPIRRFFVSIWHRCMFKLQGEGRPGTEVFKCIVCDCESIKPAGTRGWVRR